MSNLYSGMHRSQKVIKITVKLLYFAGDLILRISRGGQIHENKSLAKIDNPNTLVKKEVLIREIKTLRKWRTMVIRKKKRPAKLNTFTVYFTDYYLP